MPETVDKSSLSTFFTASSPQLRLFDFFRTGAFLHARRCVLPSLSFPAPPARSCSLSLFCFFFATSPFRCPHLSAFIVAAGTLLGCALRFPCHPFLPLHFSFAASSSGFLLSFAFPGCDACAFPPPCYTVHIFKLSQLYEHTHSLARRFLP